MSIFIEGEPPRDGEEAGERHLTEDEEDAAVARQRLGEIKASPGKLITGDELAKRLARLES